MFKTPAPRAGFRSPVSQKIPKVFEGSENYKPPKMNPRSLWYIPSGLRFVKEVRMYVSRLPAS